MPVDGDRTGTIISIIADATSGGGGSISAWTGHARVRHIGSFSGAELRRIGWTGETYFSHSQGGLNVPYVDGFDSDSDECTSRSHEHAGFEPALGNVSESPRQQNQHLPPIRPALA